jgi:hypothetical protein
MYIDPANDRSLIAVDTIKKRLFYGTNVFNFEDQRDAMVYWTPIHNYIRNNFEDVLKEFIRKGYKIFSYTSSDELDSLTNQKNDLSKIETNGFRELKLEEIISSNN